MHECRTQLIWYTDFKRPDDNTNIDTYLECRLFDAEPAVLTDKNLDFVF